jgi:hypothetical protein
LSRGYDEFWPPVSALDVPINLRTRRSSADLPVPPEGHRAVVSPHSPINEKGRKQLLGGLEFLPSPIDGRPAFSASRVLVQQYVEVFQKAETLLF